MEKKSAFGPASLSGFYLGITLIIFSLLLFLLDIDLESPFRYISYIIVAAGLFWSMISYRDKYMDGFLDYKGAFSAGFYTGLIASLIAGIFAYVYAQYIDIGLTEEILMQAETEMLENNPNMTDEQIDQALTMTEKFTSPAMMGVWGFVGNLVVSTILSLIIAIFAKRENKNVA
ncbi:MAG: hypothetical protein CMF58_02340 [Lentimicrobiaceae bacterium]|jgi:hypothetical protein|nr:hypothetical protein [Lentimicrobiaceae bacterium]MDG1900842.1 DUF4199 domain-containing protein [Bacteroidales bacterium]MDG2080868.1 DUF4199 domain-containing protein [Bacteroidales bacterium]